MPTLRHTEHAREISRFPRSRIGSARRSSLPAFPHAEPRNRTGARGSRPRDGPSPRSFSRFGGRLAPAPHLGAREDHRFPRTVVGDHGNLCGERGPAHRNAGTPLPESRSGMREPRNRLRFPDAARRISRHTGTAQRESALGPANPAPVCDSALRNASPRLRNAGTHSDPRALPSEREKISRGRRDPQRGGRTRGRERGSACRSGRGSDESRAPSSWSGGRSAPRQLAHRALLADEDEVRHAEGRARYPPRRGCGGWRRRDGQGRRWGRSGCPGSSCRCR